MNFGYETPLKSQRSGVTSRLSPFTLWDPRISGEISNPTPEQGRAARRVFLYYPGGRPELGVVVNCTSKSTEEVSLRNLFNGALNSQGVSSSCHYQILYPVK